MYSYAFYDTLLVILIIIPISIGMVTMILAKKNKQLLKAIPTLLVCLLISSAFVYLEASGKYIEWVHLMVE